MKLLIQIEIYFLLLPALVFAQQLNEGINAFENQKYQDAIFKLESYLKYNPKSEIAYVYLAQSYLALNKTPEAERTLENAIKLFPNNYEFHLLLGKLFLIKKQYLDAEQSLLKSIKLSPQKVEASKMLSIVYFNIGVDYYLGKNLKNAELYFLKSISYDSLNEKSYLNASSVLLEQKKYKEAEKIAKEGVRRFQHNIDLKKILAECYIYSGNYIEAMNLYEGIFKINKKDVETGLRLALLYRYANKTSQALTLYDSLLSYYPKEKNIYNELIDYWKLYNRQDKLREIYYRMLNVFSDEKYLLKIAESYEKENKLDSARIVYQDILEKYPLNLDARFALVKLSIKGNEIEVALQELDSILLIDIQNFDALKLKGEILFSLKKYEDAFKIFKYQADCYEKHYYPYLQIAKYYEQIEQLDSARKYLRISLSYNEKDPVIIHKLAELEAKLNNKLEAEKYYKKSLEYALKNMETLQNKIAAELDKEKFDLEKLEALEPVKGEVDELEKIIRTSLDYFKSGKYSGEYFKILNDLAKRYPLNLLLLIYKADYYESVSKYDSALQVLSKVLSVNPKLEEVHIKMAKIYERLEKYEDASMIYWRLLTTNTSAEIAFDGLIRIHTQNSTLNELGDRLLEMYKFNPNNKFLRERLIETLHKSGRYEEAKKIIESKKNE